MHGSCILEEDSFEYLFLALHLMLIKSYEKDRPTDLTWWSSRRFLKGSLPTFKTLFYPFEVSSSSICHLGADTYLTCHVSDNVLCGLEFLIQGVPT